MTRTLSHCCKTAASGSSLPPRRLGVSAPSCELDRKGHSVDAFSESRGVHTTRDFMVLEGRCWWRPSGTGSRSDPLHPSAPRPHFCSFSSCCGILEQDLKYFPANFAVFKVLWSPHFETKLARLILVGWLSCSSAGGGATAVPPSPFQWKAQGGSGLPSPARSELTSPCLFSSFLFFLSSLICAHSAHGCF